jgi:DNA polymerase-3 subunit epsilon
MKAPRGFWLWLAVLYCGILMVIGAFAQVSVMAIDAEHRQAWLRQFADAGPALAYAAAILLFACGGVLRWVFRRYPDAARQLADQTRVLLAANPEHQVTSTGGPELVEHAAVINQLAEGYHRLQRDLDAKSAEARARVEEERNRFAALMSELSEGVVVCNADGRILLYNTRAAKLVGRAEPGPARGD